jgi:hypothetical protein
MQAIAPFAFGVVIERDGPVAAIGLSVALSIVALTTLLLLRIRPADTDKLSAQEGRSL